MTMYISSQAKVFRLNSLIWPFSMLVAFVLIHGPAWACSCMGTGPVCYAYWQSPTIFRGKVLERTLLPGQQSLSSFQGGWSHFEVRFSVSEMLRGKPERETVVMTNEGGSACGFPFQDGEEYLVFAYSNQATGELWTSTCTRTHKIEASKVDADLAWMHALATASPGADIYGRLVLPPELSTSNFSAMINLGGTQKDGTISDTQGQYSFKSLPPGRYVISAVMPSGFTTIEPKVVEVFDKGCAQVDWPVYYDSHIRGRVTDARGRPLEGLLIQLQRGNNAQNAATGYAGAKIQTTDADGRFDFGRVPPDDYLLSANNLGPSPKRPYPRIYYPNTVLDTEATAIHLSPSTIVENVNVTLPNAWKEVVVRTRVLMPDGSPAIGANISAHDIDYTWSVEPSTATDGPDGTAKITVYEGRTYYLTAYLNAVPQRCAGPLKFIAKDGLTLDAITIEHNWGNCMAQLDPHFRAPR